MAALSKKLVVVGDGACGKTCLLIVFANNEFPEQYVPTVFENYVATIDLDGQKIELALWDTAGQEDYAHIRPLSYQDANVFLVCFSVDNRDSYDNVGNKWVEELTRYSPGVLYVVVGCKRDLREEPSVIEKLKAKGTTPITTAEGQRLADELKPPAYGYAECSAKNQDNVKEVFMLATRAAFIKKQGGCCIVL